MEIPELNTENIIRVLENGAWIVKFDNVEEEWRAVRLYPVHIGFRNGSVTIEITGAQTDSKYLYWEVGVRDWWIDECEAEIECAEKNFSLRKAQIDNLERRIAEIKAKMEGQPK